MKQLLLLTVVIVLVATNAWGHTWDVPSPECPTIQPGIDSATAGDTVKVLPGTYSPSTKGESFPILMEDGVVLRSSSGASTTIIDA